MLDWSPTFLSHLKLVADEASKQVSLIKKLAGSSWGASFTTSTSKRVNLIKKLAGSS